MDSINDNSMNTTGSIQPANNVSATSESVAANTKKLLHAVQDSIEKAAHVNVFEAPSSSPLSLLSLPQTATSTAPVADLQQLSALGTFYSQNSSTYQNMIGGSPQQPLVKSLTEQAASNAPKSSDPNYMSANIAALMTAVLIDKVTAEQGQVSGRQSITASKSAEFTQQVQLNAAASEQVAGQAQAAATLSQAAQMKTQAIEGIVMGVIGVIGSLAGIVGAVGSLMPAAESAATDAAEDATAEVSASDRLEGAPPEDANAELGTPDASTPEESPPEGAQGAPKEGPENASAAKKLAPPKDVNEQAKLDEINSKKPGMWGLSQKAWGHISTSSATLVQTGNTIGGAVVAAINAPLQTEQSNDQLRQANNKLLADTDTAMAGYLQSYQQAASQSSGSSQENATASIQAAAAIKNAAGQSAGTLFKG